MKHIQNYSEFLGESRGLPQHLYHTTVASRLASIQQQGLVNSKRAIYLALHEGDAEAYASYAQHEHGENSFVLFEVDLSKLDRSLLGPDDVDLVDLLDQQGDARDYSEVSWEESLEISGQCTYDGVIPYSALRIIKRWSE